MAIGAEFHARVGEVEKLQGRGIVGLVEGFLDHEDELCDIDARHLKPTFLRPANGFGKRRFQRRRRFDIDAEACEIGVASGDRGGQSIGMGNRVNDAIGPK
ncbi:hypothetical protein [Breoghania sp.]|uniref:hypothetical protein n=1 Tax=Breoghania sp. TaxID=2065378 RepID=UPI00261244AC|nr:hypothetical protein [Breoghania sp.]